MTIAIYANPKQTISLTLNTNDGYGSTFDTIQETIAINVNGKVSFTLSKIPAFLNSVLMFVNGIKQTLLTDYIIADSNIIFLNNGITLVTTDIVDFYYLSLSLNKNIENAIQDSFSVSTNGQTIFTLSNYPSSSSSVIMFVNGAKQTQNVDYNISNLIITYLNNSFSLTTADVVDFYYTTQDSASGNYTPQIDAIYYPNGSLAVGYPQVMTLLSGSIWKYSITLPAVTVGTFIVLASYISTSENFIKTETFLINVSLGSGSGSGNAFISPG